MRSVRPVHALRMALRGLRRDPATVAMAAATLAIGLGAAITLYSFVEGLSPGLPVPDGERVVQVRFVDPVRGDDDVSVSIERFRSLAETQRRLDGLGAFRTAQVVLGADAGSHGQRVPAAFVSPEAFDLLRVRPRLGRALVPEDRLDGEAVVVGHELWTDRFGARGDILGTRLRVNGEVRTVVGVMPRGFRFPFQQELWLPLPAATASSGDTTAAVELVGRLAEGATAGRAEAEMTTLWRGLEATSYANTRAVVRPFTEDRGQGGEAVALLAMAVLVGLLLIVACTNVSNLLLARATTRVRTLAVHAALGAGRAQIAMQLFAGALIVALLGSVAGFAIAAAGVAYIDRMLGPLFGYYWMRVELNPAVVAVGVGIALLAGAIAGVLPAVHVSGWNLQGALRDGSSAATGGGRREGRLSRAFVGVQVGLSVVALFAAVLLTSGLLRLDDAGAGLPMDEILTGTVVTEGERYAAAVARTAFHDAILERLEAAPGVRAVALATGLPGYREAPAVVRIPGRASDRAVDRRRSVLSTVSPGFFAVFDAEAARGRTFRPGDRGAGAGVAVVDRTFVERHGLGSDAIGRTIRVDATGVGVDDETVRIVGVIEDLDVGRRESRRGRIYLPLAQVAPSSVMIVVRAADPAALAPTVRAAVGAVDPQIPVDQLRTLDALWAYLGRFFRTVGRLGGMAGLAAVVVAMLGVYAMLSYHVRRRVPEFGVRMALGARPGDVVRLVVGRGLLQIVPGLGVGLAISYAIAPLFAIFLFGAEARDPRLFAIVAVMFVTTGLLASAVPARRAIRVEPTRALREG